MLTDQQPPMGATPPPRKHPDLLKRTAESPAEALEKTIDVTQKMATKLPATKAIRKTRDYWLTLGPGLTTGASDDDPSGIATYSQAGARYGFQFLWLSVFTLPLMAVVQEMCARIGLATGRGLAGNIRLHFPRQILYACAFLLFTTNSFNIGADLGAMAKAVQLLYPHFNFSLLVLFFSFFSLFMQIFTPYARYAKYLKWLALILFSYVASALLAHLDWARVIHAGLVPSISWHQEQLVLVAAVLGTTISPYLFFWQTSQEVEQEIVLGKTSLAKRRGTSASAVHGMRLDVWSGMLLSNIVMFFIIASCGALLHGHGITNITSAAQAAQALRPFAGEATYLLFTIGIIGTGLLAIPILAGSSSYALAESFRWREGLSRNLKQAHAFYGVIIISMLCGLAVNFIGLDPIKALIYSALGNALVAPLVLLLIVLISGNRHIMGPWRNGPFTTTLGWLVVGLMSLSSIAAVVSLF